MVTYKYIRNTNQDILSIDVKLFGKTVGKILPTRLRDGWQYFPKGKKIGGEVFTTFSEVMKSLENL